MSAPAAVDALAEPVAPVGARFISTYSAAFLGLWVAFLAPIQVLLAQQMEAIAPLHKEAALGWVTGAGAFVALLANPLCGAWSASDAYGRTALESTALLTSATMSSMTGALHANCPSKARASATPPAPRQPIFPQLTNRDLP